MNTAVAIIVFNRPDLTLQLLAAVALVKPKRLYIISDGPRADRPKEVLLVQEVRNIVDHRIDWECVVKKNYSGINLGCGRRVSSGISWVFENEEEAIILEDDCIPVASFFDFCSEMLTRYREDQRVMHIGGSNLGYRSSVKGDSYFFSKYPLIWGWATWRRAWAKYDFNASSWGKLDNKIFVKNHTFNEKEADFWVKAFNSVYEKKLDTWDYQWVLTCWLHSGLSVFPCENLIVNMGFRADATHTTNALVGYKNCAGRFEGIYCHPALVAIDNAADMKHLKKYIIPSFASRVRAKLSKLLGF